MSVKTILAILIFGFCFQSFAQPPTRGSDVVVEVGERRTPETLYKASYALVIGVSDYTAGWDDLKGVKTDVAAVKSALEKQGFVVKVLFDATESEIRNGIHAFIKDSYDNYDSRVLIYFAGHGYTETLSDEREIGYIVGADAPLPARDLNGFRSKAISMDTMRGFALQIQSKHALFVFDSCFSGKLIARGGIVVPRRIEQEVKLPVRQFITAGAANQTVPDESIFRKFFVRGIEGEADRNADGYVLASELADFLKEKVTDYSDGAQTPQYGKIRDADLDRGDFVFVAPKTSAAPPKPEPKPESPEQARLEKSLGKYRFEASRTDMEIARGEGDGVYVFKVPAQPTGILERVGGNRYKVKIAADGFFLTLLDNEIYIEQPQGNYYLPRVKADGTTENFKATDGLREIVGVYAPDSRPDYRVEITERAGAFLLLMPGFPIEKLRETAADTFVNSHLPDVFLIKASRDANGNLTGIIFVAPDSQMRYRRILR